MSSCVRRSSGAQRRSWKEALATPKRNITPADVLRKRQTEQRHAKRLRQREAAVQKRKQHRDGLRVEAAALAKEIVPIARQLQINPESLIPFAQSPSLELIRETEVVALLVDNTKPVTLWQRTKHFLERQWFGTLLGILALLVAVVALVLQIKGGGSEKPTTQPLTAPLSAP